MDGLFFEEREEKIMNKWNPEIKYLKIYMHWLTSLSGCQASECDVEALTKARVAIAERWQLTEKEEALLFVLASK